MGNRSQELNAGLTARIRAIDFATLQAAIALVRSVQDWYFGIRKEATQ
jgi:hypothetical protein